MDAEMVTFKTEVDAWVKQLRSDYSNLNELPAMMDEQEGNVQHNYELIREMRDDMEMLREEIKLLKMIQIKLIGNKLKV